MTSSSTFLPTLLGLLLATSCVSSPSYTGPEMPTAEQVAKDVGDATRATPNDVVFYGTSIEPKPKTPPTPPIKTTQPMPTSASDDIKKADDKEADPKKTPTKASTPFEKSPKSKDAAPSNTPAP